MLNKYFFIYFYAVFIIYFDFVKTQESCTAARNQPGNCIFLTDCAVYYNLLVSANSGATILTPDQRTTISNSWCGTVGGKYKVCCPVQPTRATTTTPKITTSPQLTSNNQPIFENRDYSSHKSVQLFQPEICGNIVDDKISNGNITEILEFTWMAIIQYRTGDGIEQLCGGSVISKRYILTAAHCIARLQGGYTVHSVVLGEHNTATEIDCHRRDPSTCSDPIQTIEVESVISHPLYNKRLYENDIGLIRLKSDIDFNTESVKPICLPISLQAQRAVKDIQIVKVTGWGKTENGTKSPDLLQANLKVINNTHCSTLYSRKTSLQIKQTHLCAGTGESDSCQGDSGGPAIYPVNLQYGPRYVQFGVVSAGISACGNNPGLPGIYTRVTPYMQWILDSMVV